jgi:hypothetical protein
MNARKQVEMLDKLLAANADRESVSSLADVVSEVLVIATVWLDYALG